MSLGTWARNEFDDRSLSAGEMLGNVLRLKAVHKQKYGKPLKAVRLSRLTLLMFPLMPTQDAKTITTLGGIPIEIDDSLGAWEFKEVRERSES